MRHRFCEECNRRQAHYAHAAAEQVRLVREQRDLEAAPGPGPSETLLARIDAADRRRAEAEQAVMEHEWAAHSGALEPEEVPPDAFRPVPSARGGDRSRA